MICCCEMKKVFFFRMLAAVTVFFSSCNNSAPDADKSAQIAYDSLSVTGDTIAEHASDFSTALHQMTNDINQIPLTGNAERDFAVLLKGHHQGAVNIAQAELKNGKDDALKEMAQNISTTYKQEIAALDAFVDSLKNGPVRIASSSGDKEGRFNSIIKKHKAMMWDMAKMDTNMVADKQFVAVMISHLQSAVFLAEGYLKYGKDVKLMGMAKEIVPRKNKQIEELNKWMNKNKNTSSNQ